MKRVIAILWCILCITPVTINAQRPDSIAYSLDIEEVTIKYERPVQLSEVGINKTVIDSFALKESINISMADLLSLSSSIFVKSYGRATLSTVSLRGASPSHTLVTWNGMKINSPMLGMTDFSLIPSWFIDDVELYRGAGSIGISGGGLGGAISLSTHSESVEEVRFQYIQGISSFKTFDQYAKLTYGNSNVTGSTRVYYVTSKNDFKYTNYRKKIFVNDNAGNITNSYYPVEKNKNGSFSDLHVLQEASLTDKNGGTWNVALWFTGSKRGVPFLNVDYREINNSKNRQDENSLKAVFSWNKNLANIDLDIEGGYSYSDLKYIYLGDAGYGNLEEMVHSQSYVNTMFISAKADYFISNKWFLSIDIAGYQHFAKSIDDALDNASKEKIIKGYEKARFETSTNVALKYRPINRLGISIDIREETYSNKVVHPIPALFAEYILSYPGNIKIKSSIARNYRHPTLNDMYFMPGGNDSLKTEKGYTYDFGTEFKVDVDNIIIEGRLTGYDSYITDWILWLPTHKGFWSPVNVNKVHSYGLEAIAKTKISLGEQKDICFDGNFSITRSKNVDRQFGDFDNSAGGQLVYIPVYSSSLTSLVNWRQWLFSYKWNYYSKRFTTTSNEQDVKIGVLNPYFMSDISLSRTIHAKAIDFYIKFQVNNLFNEEYESVLSRPMARRNYGLFIGVRF